MIEVRTMKLSLLWDMEEFLYSEASQQRREKASRFLHADDRLRCLAAGYLLKRCLPGYSEALHYMNVNGKPFMRDGVPFSISHGGNYIALAWCEGAGDIGVDVEPIRETEYYRAILPRFMTSGELNAVGENAKDIVRVWTRKESLYKCVGGRISDVRELPEVLEKRVLFGGAECFLSSWEKDGHMFSVALRDFDQSMEFHIKPVGIL